MVHHRCAGRTSEILERVLRAASALTPDPDLPPFLWLRSLAHQEIGSAGAALAPASSAALAEQLLGRRSLDLQRALVCLDTADREILFLRHLERLTNAEAAFELGLPSVDASRRYVAALKKLKQVLAAMEQTE